MPQNYITAQMDELRLDHPRNTEDLQDEHIFSLICLKFFYKNGIFENRDIYNHWTDGANDGGIDSIIADTDQDKLIFIQVYLFFLKYR